MAGWGRKESLVWLKKRETGKKGRAPYAALTAADPACLPFMFCPLVTHTITASLPALSWPSPGAIGCSPHPGSKPGLEYQGYISRQRQCCLHSRLWLWVAQNNSAGGSRMKNDMLQSLWLPGSAVYHARNPRKPGNMPQPGRGAVRLVSTSPHPSCVYDSLFAL